MTGHDQRKVHARSAPHTLASVSHAHRDERMTLAGSSQRENRVRDAHRGDAGKMSQHVSSSAKYVPPRQNNTEMGEEFVARAKPSAGDRPIGIACRVCGRELRDNDDLSVHAQQLAHLTCAMSARDGSGRVGAEGRDQTRRQADRA